MSYSKFNIKDLAKILFGLNIICLFLFFLLSYFNIIFISKANLLYLIIFAFLFIANSKNNKLYNKNAGYYFCSVVFVGELFFLFQVFFKLGRNFIN